MSIKNILVHVETAGNAPAQVAAALEFAKAEDATSTTGLCVRPALPFVRGEIAQIPPEVIDSYNKTLDQELFPAAKKIFKSAAKKAGIQDKAVWETAVGDTAQLLERKGRYADLIIVGQTQQEDTLNNYHRLSDNLVMMAGRPVLVIPDVGIGDSIGKKILVAWDGSREAGRAVSDALDILKRADEVHLFSAGDSKEQADKKLKGLKEYLSNHGIEATEVLGVTGVKEAGEVMLDHVKHADLDMIVMGAYGHSRFREMVLGGATRHVLEHTTVPILMSH